MHIVLSGYFGFNNEGDEIILKSMVQQLKSHMPDVLITVLSNQPKKPTQIQNVKTVNRWNALEVIKTLKTSDGLISGGGSLFQDQTSLKTVPYYASIIHCARLLKKPVFIYAQGFGPLNHLFSRWLTRLTLNHTQAITVRDQESKELLTQIKVKKSIKVVPDAVFGLHVNYKKSSWLDNFYFEKPFIVVSLRNWSNMSHFKHTLPTTLDKVIDQGYEIVFMSMQGEEDENFAQSISSKMTNKTYHIPIDCPFEEKLSIISQSILLLGMRLHALIFSSLVSTPFGAFSYDPKIESFATQVEQDVLLKVSDDTINQDKLYQSILTLINERDTYKKSLIYHVNHFKAEAKKTTHLAFNIFS